MVYYNLGSNFFRIWKPLPNTYILAKSPYTEKEQFTLVVNGDYLYCTGTNGGLRVIDISNPLTPSVEATYSYAKGEIFISGQYAYFADSNDGFKILDISDPLNATLRGTLSLPGSPSDLTVFNNHAYIANGWNGNGGGIQVINVSDPLNPYLVQSYNDRFDFVVGIRDYI